MTVPRAPRPARLDGDRLWSAWHSGSRHDAVQAVLADRAGAVNGAPARDALARDPAARQQLHAAGLYVHRGPAQEPGPVPDGDCGQLAEAAARAGLHECGYPPRSRSCLAACGRP